MFPVSRKRWKISRLSWRLGRDSAAERLPRRPSKPDNHKPKQTKTSQNLKPPNIPISSPKVQNSEASWEALKQTQVSASFQSPKMKRTPKYKIVLNSKSERGKVIMMMMMALSFVHSVCDPGIGFHLILQSLLLSHFTVTLFFFFFFCLS